MGQESGQGKAKTQWGEKHAMESLHRNTVKTNSENKRVQSTPDLWEMSNSFIHTETAVTKESAPGTEKHMTKQCARMSKIDERQ